MKKNLSLSLVLLVAIAMAACKKEANPTPMQAANQKQALQTTPPRGNVWTQLAPPVITAPGPVPTDFRNFTFSANDKLYVALPEFNQLWQYDFATAQWTLKQSPFFNFQADLQGSFQYAFTNGNDIYFLNPATKSLKQYNLLTAQWADKANFPGTAISGVAAAFTATRGYVLAGTNGLSDNMGLAYTVAENWEYDFAGNTWAVKANTPGLPRYNAAAIAVGDKVYFGTGIGVSTFFNPFSHILSRSAVIESDWWEYNSTGNSWTQRSPFGGGTRQEASGFVIDGKVYLGWGTAGYFVIPEADLWCYDPAADVWGQRSSYPPGGPHMPLFSTAGAASHGFAINYDLQTFWMYTPPSPIITPGMNGTAKPFQP